MSDTLKRWSVFPVLTTIITARFAILLPLLVLARQAWQSLNALSDQAVRVTNRSTLIDARRSEVAMTNVALEMERSYRQYCVLDDPTLAKVYQSQRKRYSDMLDAHAGVCRMISCIRRYARFKRWAQLQCKDSGPGSGSGRASGGLCQREYGNGAGDAYCGLFCVATVTTRNRRARTIFRLAGAGAILVSLSMVLLYPHDYRAGIGIERMINRPGEGRS